MEVASLKRVEVDAPKARVLVVDDEPGVLDSFRKILTSVGYSIDTVETAQEALTLIRMRDYDLFFTDLKMPGMDGFEVLRSIKKHKPGTEVIVITGHGDMDLVIQALNLEATDFINKPVTRSALASALKRAEARLAFSDHGQIHITPSETGNATLITIEGTLGRESREDLQRAFTHSQGQPGGPNAVVIHFEANAAVNGAGIGELVKWLAELRRQEKRAAISGLSENFQTIFEMVGLGRYAAFFDTPGAAVTALSTEGAGTPTVIR